MKKETIILMMLIFALQGNAQDMGMCTYDVAGNRLSRFTYSLNRGNNFQQTTKRDGQVDMANERLGNHTIHVTYQSTTCTITIEVLGLDDSDDCAVYIYNLTGQMVYNQSIVASPTKVDLFDNSNGVYLLRLYLNGENRCWKIIKK